MKQFRELGDLLKYAFERVNVIQLGGKIVILIHAVVRLLVVLAKHDLLQEAYDALDEEQKKFLFEE